MQGVIGEGEKVDGYWLVYIPQYGENKDIGDIMIKKEDLILLPNGMNAKINEEIKIAFENSKKINRHLNCTHKPNGKVA